MKVIIVEDEMLIAQATKMQLVRQGIEVKGIARSGEAFWEIMDNSVSIVLMDVKLKKGESGIELAKEIRLKYPELPILFTTGNTRKFVEQNFESTENIEILNKPLVSAELFEMIQRMILKK